MNVQYMGKGRKDFQLFSTFVAMAGNGMENSFAWSLKPLDFASRVFVGVPLNFYNYKIHFKSRLCFILLGCFILLFHLLINGPRGFKISKFDWMAERENYRSPFIFFKDHPDAILQFTVDVTSILFFVSTSLIHLVFWFNTVLWSQKWQDLVFVLKEIQNKMNLSEGFYRKCRRHCMVALLVLILVRVFFNYTISII